MVHASSLAMGQGAPDDWKLRPSDLTDRRRVTFVIDGDTLDVETAAPVKRPAAMVANSRDQSHVEACLTLRWRTIRRTASARADPPTGPVVAVGTPRCARSGSGGRGRPRSPAPRR